MEDVKHPTSNQPLSVGESSHAAEERARPSRTANQHSPEQQHEEPTPTAEEPSAASGGTMGVVVVEKSSTRNPTTEALAEATAIEEEAKLKEIVRLEEENVAPQCIRVARKRAMSGCSMMKTTRTGPSANCSGQ
jgi:hypothetical protein